MNILTVQFDYGQRDIYARQLKAFENSVKLNSPSCTFTALTVKPPQVHAGKQKALFSNTLKLKLWCDHLDKTDELTLLADCDMLVLKDLSDIEDYDFDIAFTRRDEHDHIPLRGVTKNGINAIELEAKRKAEQPVLVHPHPDFEIPLDENPEFEDQQEEITEPPQIKCPSYVFVPGKGRQPVSEFNNVAFTPKKLDPAERAFMIANRGKGKHPSKQLLQTLTEGCKKAIPYNGGIVFVRPNERSRKFMHRWKQINDMMLADHGFHSPWRYIYAGMNQAAFGYMVEKESDLCHLASLKCGEWNGCDRSWLNITPELRILHVKSKLRKYCTGLQPYPPQFEKVVRMWRYYETVNVAKVLSIAKDASAVATMNSEEAFDNVIQGMRRTR